LVFIKLDVNRCLLRSIDFFHFRAGKNLISQLFTLVTEVGVREKGTEEDSCSA
jgi:hypothetical protein